MFQKCFQQCPFFHNCEARRALPLKCGYSCERFRDRTCRHLQDYRGSLDNLRLPWLNWKCEELDPRAESRFATEGGYLCPFPSFSALPKELRIRAHAGDKQALGIIAISHTIRAATITHRLQGGPLGELKGRLLAQDLFRDWPFAATAYLMEKLERRQRTQFKPPPLKQEAWNKLSWTALRNSATELLRGPEREKEEVLFWQEVLKTWPDLKDEPEQHVGLGGTGIVRRVKFPRRECRRCGGKGKVSNPFADISEPEEFDCPACGGSGRRFRERTSPHPGDMVKAWSPALWEAMRCGETLEKKIQVTVPPKPQAVQLCLPKRDRDLWWPPPWRVEPGELERPEHVGPFEDWYGEQIEKGSLYVNVPQPPPPGPHFENPRQAFRPAVVTEFVSTHKEEPVPMPRGRRHNTRAPLRRESLAQELLERCEGAEYPPTLTQILQWPDDILYAIRKLGKKQARAVLCCRIGDYKPAALDQELGLARGTTARNLRRAKAKLRGLLEEEQFTRLFGADTFRAESADIFAKVPVGSV